MTTISTSELKELFASGADVRVFDVSVAQAPTQEDPVIAFQKGHIKGAQYLDLKISRDLSSPFPFMMPSQAFFVMIAKHYDIRKSVPVVIYDC